MGARLPLGLFAGTQMGLRWVPVPGLWEMAVSPGLLQICLAPCGCDTSLEGARPSWTFPGPKATPRGVSLYR